MTTLPTLIRKRDAHKAKVTTLSKFVDKAKIELDDLDSTVEQKQLLLSELQLRISKFEAMWKEYSGVQNNIESLSENFDEELNERDAFESNYYKVGAAANFLLSSYKTVEEAQSVHNGSNATQDSQQSNVDNENVCKMNIRLPQIQLPEFKGNYESWLEFRDTFQSMVHNNQNIGAIEKFHYLRSVLKDSASQVIRSIEFSATNYNMAWELICERYNNKTVLVNTHVKSLFNLPAVNKESAHDLRSLLDQISKNLRSLQILELPVEHWDTLIIYIVTGRLDRVTAREWEEKKKEATPTLHELREFLRQKADLLETLELNKTDKTDRSKDNQRTHKTKAFKMVVIKCAICQGEHLVSKCTTFINNYGPESRYKVAKAINLCINCLRTGHITSKCRSRRCTECNAMHHTLLHRRTDKPAKVPADRINSQQPLNTTASNANTIVESPNNTSEQVTTGFTTTEIRSPTSQVLLSSAMVNIVDSQGKNHPCRALLDCGAQSNFISTECCHKLNIKPTQIRSSVVGINQVISPIKQKCKIQLSSMHTGFQTFIECLLLDNLGELPNQPFDISLLNLPGQMKLADPTCHIPSPVEIILGAEVFWKILCVGQHHIGVNSPTLQKTQLGWILTGSVYANTIIPQFKCHLVRDATLKLQLEKFWQIEEVGATRVLSLNEQHCEELFAKSTKRTSDGRFVVQIPLNNASTVLGKSDYEAQKRLLSMEKRMARNPNLKRNYTQFMEEYEKLGHMSKVDLSSDKKERIFLPHHGVVNESSTTTKLRVVFDGSTKTSSGYSFNDIQIVGPTLQDELLNIILRFRQHTYIICADIAKMYRQILIEPSQRHLQCIYWRKNPTEAFDTYELNTVTYGTASAPYLAVRCLRQLDMDNQQTSPIASKIILSDFYVDDLITGGENIADLSSDINTVRAILKSGGFLLHKWISNDSNIIPESTSSGSTQSVDFGKGEGNKTLGLYWTPEEDSLIYKISNVTNSKSITKRTILSEISQIFDPLGLLAPSVMMAKILLQQLWLLKLTWDESLPQSVVTEWLRFRTTLPKLNALQIPRHALCQNPCFIELHGFADASKDGYGACIYVRSISNQQDVQVHLLIAKSRVAPIKMVTIPRLELCAATLLTQLMVKVKDSLTASIDAIHFWSDSTVVLHWIRLPANTLQVFVGNRVSQIQSLSDLSQWHHINSADNPADVLSRGAAPEILLSHHLWWHGPSFLQHLQYELPNSQIQFDDDTPELRRSDKVFQLSETIEKFPFTKFNTLTKLKRVLAYVLRFAVNCQTHRDQRHIGELSAKEIYDANILLIKLCQESCFKTEILNMKKGQQVSPKSKLFNLNPFLDKEGIIRVGGRIQASEYSYGKQHPMVLGKSHFTTLLLTHEHQLLGHAGLNHTLSSVREKYWPISGRSILKKILHSCITCFKVHPKIASQVMGNLPADRITPQPPFVNTGIDYAGPFQIKDKMGRGCKLQKAYICMFICMTVKAIHIEVVTDLSMETFIAALRRFSSRRGKPQCIHTDNATNFVAANKELKELFNFLDQNQNQITTTLANDGIAWKFIPPRAPHFGGLWEAGVKMVKNHLKRMLGNTNLTYELFSTILIQIEAILNSRPLVPLSSDPNDFAALTPAHFLIGRQIVSIPDPNVTEISESRLTRFQYVQRVHQQFWARWKREYLSELQVRVKWNKFQTNLQEGTLVLIKEDNTPPLLWRLGRIVQVLPGPDGQVRVANIRTQHGLVKRAFSRICPLPTPDNDSVG